MLDAALFLREVTDRAGGRAQPEQSSHIQSRFDRAGAGRNLVWAMGPRRARRHRTSPYRTVAPAECYPPGNGGTHASFLHRSVAEDASQEAPRLRDRRAPARRRGPLVHGRHLPLERRLREPLLPEPRARSVVRHPAADGVRRVERLPHGRGVPCRRRSMQRLGLRLGVRASLRRRPRRLRGGAPLQRAGRVRAHHLRPGRRLPTLPGLQPTCRRRPGLRREQRLPGRDVPGRCGLSALHCLCERSVRERSRTLRGASSGAVRLVHPSACTVR